MPEVVITPEVKPDPSKPVEGKVDATGAVVVDTSKPAPNAAESLILGKFKTQADLEQAYTELEKKQGAAPVKPEESKPEVAPTPAAAQKAVKEAGLDMNDLSREVADKGELSKESLAKLEEKGISKETVDAYIAGQKAIAAQFTKDVQAVAGGEEQYAKMIEWATANATDEQVAAFDEAVNSGNTNLAKLAVKGLFADYSAAVGVDGKMVDGNNSPSTAGVVPFQSQAEVTAAMRDPRYKNGDIAYIKSVEQRLEKSKIFG